MQGSSAGWGFPRSCAHLLDSPIATIPVTFTVTEFMELTWRSWIPNDINILILGLYRNKFCLSSVAHCVCLCCFILADCHYFLHDLTYCFVFGMAQQPLVGHGLLSVKAYDCTQTPLHEWSARRRDVWQHTTLKRDRNPWPQRDSNTQSQHASGFRPTLETARPLRSVSLTCIISKDYK
jgi:hypothetical protein